MRTHVRAPAWIPSSTTHETSTCMAHRCAIIRGLRAVTCTQARAFGLLPGAEAAPWSDLECDRLVCDRCCTSIPNLFLRCNTCKWEVCVSCMRAARGAPPVGPFGCPSNRQVPMPGDPPAPQPGAVPRAHRCPNPECATNSDGGSGGGAAATLYMGRVFDDTYVAALRGVAREYGQGVPPGLPPVDDLCAWATLLTGLPPQPQPDPIPEETDAGWVKLWGHWIPAADVRMAAARHVGADVNPFEPWAAIAARRQAQAAAAVAAAAAAAGVQARVGAGAGSGVGTSGGEEAHARGTQAVGRDQGEGGAAGAGPGARAGAAPHFPASYVIVLRGEDFMVVQRAGAGDEEPPITLTSDDFLFAPSADALLPGHPRYRTNMQVLCPELVIVTCPVRKGPLPVAGDA